MAIKQMSEVIRHLRRTVSQRGDERTDAQLLESFLRQREEAALAVLIRRHGPMVWGVCRRLLRSHHDAEDAFQATFLVLVQKGTTIRDPEMVGNWIYGVAHQTAVRMRTTAAKRGARERQMTEMPEPAAAEHDLRNDLRPLLDRALTRLPDKYRVLIVLCDLEGKTRKQVARQLTLPEGTVAGRLARARALLAKRLTRDGFAISGGMLGVVLSAQAAASIPAVVLSSTIHAATLLAAGKTGAISAEVLTLTEGVMKAMLLTKLKLATAFLLAVVVTGLSVKALAQPGGVQPAAFNGVRSQSAAPVGEGDPKGRAEDESPASAEDISAVARKMGVIKDRLKMASGGKQTQKLQSGVVIRLDELIKALENLENRKPNLDGVLAELKLIRAMQNRINVRTKVYGDAYKGEQVPPPETARDPREREQFETIRQELKELATRQEKVAPLTNALARARD
jgi:RNA polymerase sigma factor (sigma-70 family)